MSGNSSQKLALRQLIRSNLRFLTTSALVFGAGAFPALAQDAGAADKPAAAPTEELETITVSGIRAALASAQAIKQNTDQFVDSITAIDIGRLPDVNVAETLQRISGIQISRNFGEGSGIAIRGLTQVRSELNGRDIFTANGGRGLSWEEVGSDLLAGVDVYKNPSAELVEGGLGGTINLRTRKPFDSPGQVFSATGGFNRYDLVEDDGKFASALYSNRWEVGGGDLGVLFNLSYGDTAFRRDRAVVEPFWNRTDVPGFTGQEVFVNAGGGLGVGAGTRERQGAAFAVQWAPSENSEYYAQFLTADYQIDDVQYSWFAFGPNQSGGNLNPVDGTFTFDENGNLLTGTLRNPPSNSNTGGNQRNSRTSDFALGAKWKIGDQLTVGTDVQYVEARTDVQSLILYTALLNNTMLPGAGGQEWFFHMDLTGDFPRYRISPDNYAADIDSYFYQAIQEHREKNDADSLAARVDLTWEFEEEGFLNDIRSGVRFTDKAAINRSSSWGHWGGVGSCESWSSINNCYRMAAFSDHAQLSPFQGNFLRGEGRDAVIGPNYAWLFADSHNPVQAFSFVNRLLVTQNNAPYSGFNSFDDPSTTTSNIDEQTSAAYIMLRFGSEIGSKAWDGNLGVRYVRTESAANAFASFNYRDPSFMPDPMNPGASPQVISSGRLPITADNSYDHVLPSLNLRLHATDKLQVRFAASKNVTRPDFTQLNGDFNVTPTYADGAGDVIPETLSTAELTGNPFLKPMQVTQFDASVEWYFSDVGYVYGTVFHKKLKDLFFTATDLVTFEFPELGPLDFQVRHLTNVDEGKLKGFEVGGQRFMDFLPAPWDGLGIQANYTYVDSNATTIAASDITAGSSIEVPVQGLSENSYNLVLLYDKSDLNARLAYNWRDDWVETTAGNGTGGLPIFARPFGQLDGSVSYDFNDNLSMTLDAVNILDEHHRTYQGVSARDRDYQVDDRRLGLRFRVQF